jgi:8-hydroxy-5-deazaflavin:NADPH oxidoreductase
MKIAVIGTGMVGRTFASRLIGLGHDVVIGTRGVTDTLSRTDQSRPGMPPYSEWQREHPDVGLASFADAGAHGEVIINATAGVATLNALEAVGADNLAGKVLVDIALPLDGAPGQTRSLVVANTDSLGEQIQRAYPDARVVKTLNTVFVEVMVDPARYPGGTTSSSPGMTQRPSAPSPPSWPSSAGSRTPSSISGASARLAA